MEWTKNHYQALIRACVEAIVNEPGWMNPSIEVKIPKGLVLPVNFPRGRVTERGDGYEVRTVLANTMLEWLRKRRVTKLTRAEIGEYKKDVSFTINGVDKFIDSLDLEISQGHNGETDVEE